MKEPPLRCTADERRLLALWAAACAERVLGRFEKSRPEDDRPRHAIEAARAWSAGAMTMTEARRAAFSSHAAARQCSDDAACFAARAAGHAAATAHVADHARHAAAYAIKAVGGDGKAQAIAESDWQRRQFPDGLRESVRI